PGTAPTVVAEGVERSLMDVVHDAGADFDADLNGPDGADGPEHRRWGRRVDSLRHRRRLRRRLAAVLAVVGVVGIIAGSSPARSPSPPSHRVIRPTSLSPTASSAATTARSSDRSARTGRFPLPHSPVNPGVPSMHGNT